MSIEDSINAVVKGEKSMEDGVNEIIAELKDTTLRAAAKTGILLAKESKIPTKKIADRLIRAASSSTG